MLTRQRARTAAAAASAAPAAAAADAQPRPAGRQQAGSQPRSSSLRQPAALSRKRPCAASDASAHGSDNSNTTAEHGPGERLPELMHTLAAHQSAAAPATRSAAAAAAAAAAAIRLMALAAPATLGHALLAQPQYISTLLAAALDNQADVAREAAGAIHALLSTDDGMHVGLLEAFAQQQHVQLIVQGLQQDSSIAAKLAIQLSAKPPGQQELLQHIGVLLQLCQQQAAISLTVQRAAAITAIALARTAAGQQVLKQHNLSPLLAGMTGSGLSAVAAAGIVDALVISNAAHEVLLPYVAELLAAADPQHRVNVAAPAGLVDVVVAAVHEIAVGSAAGSQAVMQHTDALIAAMQQPAEPEELVDAAMSAGVTLLHLLQAEGGLQAFLQQQQQQEQQQGQQQQGQLGRQLITLLQLMGQDGDVAFAALDAYGLIAATPEGHQALVPHIAELLSFAQPHNKPVQASCAMDGVVDVADTGPAGSQAVFQHLEGVAAAIQQLDGAHPAVQSAACRVVMLLVAAAAEHGQQLPPQQHIQAAVDALLQLVQLDDMDEAGSAARMLLHAGHYAACQQLLFAPERMVLVLKRLKQLYAQVDDEDDDDDDEGANGIYKDLLGLVRLLVRHAAQQREVPAFLPHILEALPPITVTQSSKDIVMTVTWAFYLLAPLVTFPEGQRALLPFKGRLRFFTDGFDDDFMDETEADGAPFNVCLREVLAALDAALVQLQADQQQAQLAVQQAGVAAAQAQVQHRQQRMCVQLQAEFVAQLQQLDAASTHNQQLKQQLVAA